MTECTSRRLSCSPDDSTFANALAYASALALANVSNCHPGGPMTAPDHAASPWGRR